MTIKIWLNESQLKLTDAGSETPRLDAEILLSEFLGKDRSWLIAHDDQNLETLLRGGSLLQGLSLQKLNGWLVRRIKHEPLAYILGYKEFYGRKFKVDKTVLVPRPESEMMLELLFQQIEDWRLEIGDELQIIDVGTGSGNLIITTLLEMSKVESRKSKVSYIGLDISEEALKVARKNAKNLGANVEFKNFDLMKDDLSSILNPQSSILLCNLPYVPNEYSVNKATKYEPKIALFSGKDGLDHYRRLFEQLSQGEGRREKGEVNNKNRIVITESLIEQHGNLRNIAEKAGFKQTAEKDLIQVFSRPSTL